MKKLTTFFLILTVFSAFFFTSCIINSESSKLYFEKWTAERGEVTFKDDKYSNSKTLDKFYNENEIPENLTGSVLAKRYKHHYRNTPYCTIYIKEWRSEINYDYDDDIGYYEVKKSDRFFVEKTAQEVLGLWVYCDDEYVYVINPYYGSGFRDKNPSELPEENKSYRIVVDLNGVADLEIDLTKTQSKNPWEN